MTEMARLIKLTSAPGIDSGLRVSTAVPCYVAMQSPLLRICLEAGFLEARTHSIALDSITPDALRQCVSFLRDPTTMPELESVMETLYAAKYLELDRLVELCCKLMARHYEDLPPETLHHLDSELVLRICRRLTPLQLCQAEKYISLKTKNKL